jgi:hypothetical protein
LAIETLEGRLLLAADYGDAPEPYPTMHAADGARHETVGPLLGAFRDAEPDALATSNATGDDAVGEDDEDGVVFGSLQVGQRHALATVHVTNASGDTFLDAWIDFDRDGV